MLLRLARSEGWRVDPGSEGWRLDPGSEGCRVDPGAEGCRVEYLSDGLRVEWEEGDLQHPHPADELVGLNQLPERIPRLRHHIKHFPPQNPVHQQNLPR